MVTKKQTREKECTNTLKNEQDTKNNMLASAKEKRQTYAEPLSRMPSQIHEKYTQT